MLLLNETTLFYHDLSSQKTDKSAYGIISDWSSEVQGSVKGSHVPQAWSGLSTTAIGTISSARPTTGTSLNGIAIVTKDSKPQSKAVVRGQGAKLFEEDEDDECEVALASPLTGGQGLANTVRCM
jgi:hypothetical protein